MQKPQRLPPSPTGRLPSGEEVYNHDEAANDSAQLHSGQPPQGVSTVYSKEGTAAHVYATPPYDAAVETSPDRIGLETSSAAAGAVLSGEEGIDSGSEAHVHIEGSIASKPAGVDDADEVREKKLAPLITADGAFPAGTSPNEALYQEI